MVTRLGSWGRWCGYSGWRCCRGRIRLSPAPRCLPWSAPATDELTPDEVEVRSMRASRNRTRAATDALWSANHAPADAYVNEPRAPQTPTSFCRMHQLNQLGCRIAPTPVAPGEDGQAVHGSISASVSAVSCEGPQDGMEVHFNTKTLVARSPNSAWKERRLSPKRVPR